MKKLNQLFTKLFNVESKRRVTSVLPIAEAFFTINAHKFTTKSALQSYIKKNGGVELSSSEMNLLLEAVARDMTRFGYSFAISCDDIMIIKPHHSFAEMAVVA